MDYRTQPRKRPRHQHFKVGDRRPVGVRPPLNNTKRVRGIVYWATRVLTISEQRRLSDRDLVPQDFADGHFAEADPADVALPGDRQHRDRSDGMGWLLPCSLAHAFAHDVVSRNVFHLANRCGKLGCITVLRTRRAPVPEPSNFHWRLGM